MSLKIESEGEFKGWSFWPSETFECETVGPFYFKKSKDGSYISRYRSIEKHMNAGGYTHGGCLMSFADFSLFAIASDHIQDNQAVTVAFNCEFLAGSKVGQLMEGSGEVLRAGRSIIFVRGMITADKEVCLNFSGAIKKI
ncbi:PaaI family thioesterase [Hellea balneolensis]|uniref:PaaI family thioesterase n=1 Tax=Hellea balneolensis TaxID=287478 RepID=UPI00041E4917|nr:PaaI family thioesterase [Hellea balneolensis]